MFVGIDSSIDKFWITAARIPRGICPIIPIPTSIDPKRQPTMLVQIKTHNIVDNIETTINTLNDHPIESYLVVK